MTAGDLTPNMIGNTRIRTRFEDADIEGRLTDMGIRTESDAIRSMGGDLAHETIRVNLSITVGRITMDSVRLDHPVQIIR